MDGKLDGYKLDRFKLLDLVESGGVQMDEKELQQILPITVQVIYSKSDSDYCCSDGKFMTCLSFKLDQGEEIEGRTMLTNEQTSCINDTFV